MEIKQDKSIVELKQTIETQVTEVANFKITSNETCEKALQIRKSFLALTKQIKAKEKEATDPIRAGLDVVKGWFAPMKEAVENADTYFNSELERWRIKKEKEAKEKTAEIQEKVVSGKMTLEQAGKQIERAETKASVIPTTKVATVRILDFAKLSDEYKLPDLVKIKSDLKAGKTIEGAELYDEIINVRR